MNNFVAMILHDAIDQTMDSPEANQKINEPEKAVIVDLSRRRHHTVQERRKWDAKEKAYIMPKCGLRPTKIREMWAMKAPGSECLTLVSEKDMNQYKHDVRAYEVWSREEAKRDRHPKATLEAIIDEYEATRSDNGPGDFDFIEYLEFIDHDIENNLNTSLQEDNVWDEMNDLVSRGDLYFPPKGGMFVASGDAFQFVCEHQSEVLGLIS